MYHLYAVHCCTHLLFNDVISIQMAHPKLGSFDGNVILPVKLFKSKGKVSLLYIINSASYAVNIQGNNF